MVASTGCGALLGFVFLTACSSGPATPGGSGRPTTTGESNTSSSSGSGSGATGSSSGSSSGATGSSSAAGSASGLYATFSNASGTNAVTTNAKLDSMVAGLTIPKDQQSATFNINGDDSANSDRMFSVEVDSTTGSLQVGQDYPMGYGAGAAGLGSASATYYDNGGAWDAKMGSVVIDAIDTSGSGYVTVHMDNAVFGKVNNGPPSTMGTFQLNVAGTIRVFVIHLP
jgi:hypothetical protein